ncbi:type II secretion system protein J [Gimesia aquarii]|uniref:Prepilin-type N-terminal cleavage/methylation domain-containing protein n=1 Tax=Gimesia aquarii TaxID=2527964 RepID=A0A517WNK2_9PLAN|nr:prepilin-type N-terminal cleavage/methylation domain-containing protein [Gimesia aquarii]QDU06808.1 hypothetical protein V202x_01510 [Gimesia aquarii]
MNKLRMIETVRTNSALNITSALPKGVSLIEMLLAMALMSVIFTLGASILAFLMRVEMEGTNRIQKTFNLQRLSHQFREDARSAQSVEIVPENNKKSTILKFEMKPETSILYSENTQGNGILRLKKQSNKTITRTEYPISEDALYFEIEKQNPGLMVSMNFRILPEVLHENQTLNKPGNSFKVESQVNRKFSIQKSTPK